MWSQVRGPRLTDTEQPGVSPASSLPLQYTITTSDTQSSQFNIGLLCLTQIGKMMLSLLWLKDTMIISDNNMLLLLLFWMKDSSISL